ncbi:MAG: hypothetical protein HY670_06265 [Chloroflexi bacterium]|nr:hypothetical protein [Chloroflexota bacterium]
MDGAYYPGYPSDRLPKGLVLAVDGVALVEEGTGFGVPLLRYGSETIFPGNARLTERKDGLSLRVEYELNLVQRLVRESGRSPRLPFYDPGREWFSTLHRRYPFLRGPISGTAGHIKRLMGLRTQFEAVPTVAVISVTYTIGPEPGQITVATDLAQVRNSIEVILANEQGASHFDAYFDSDGARLEGKAIGTWDEVMAQRVSLIGRRRGVFFALSQVAGARLFRGRELKTGTLAWSGLNYVLASHPTHFTYDITVGESDDLRSAHLSLFQPPAP